MKIAINKCYGGFGLSKKAYEWLGMKWDGYGYEFKDDRSNQRLIQCIEALGEKASGEYAKLHIVEIPDDVEFEIEEYDGFELVAEKHRTWG